MATFKQFYEENITIAFLSAMGFLKDPMEAEDILSDCFVKVWKKWDELPADIDRKRYLFKILKNACLTRLRDLKVEQKHLEAYTPLQEWGGGRNRGAGVGSCSADEAR